MNTGSSGLAFIPYHCTELNCSPSDFLFTKEQTLFLFLSHMAWNENSTDFLTRAFCDCEIEPEALTTYFLKTVFSRTLSKKWKECGVLERPVFIVFAKPLHHLYLGLLSILLS